METAIQESKPSGESRDLEYPKAGFSKRLGAFGLDFVCAFFIATLVGTGLKYLLGVMPFYASTVESMETIQLASGLYEESGGEIEVVTDATGDVSDYQSLDADYEGILASYYSNEEFFSAADDGPGVYAALKIGDGAIKNSVGNDYFVYADESKTTIVMSSAETYETLKTFYVSAIDDYAVPSLGNIEAFRSCSVTIFWSNVLAVGVTSAIFGFTLIFYVIPLFFRRGRQTFGKLLFKISLVDAKAMTPSLGRFTLRSTFFLLIELLLGAASFGLPLIVSISMFAFRKDGACLHDYICGTYVVDSSDDMIYLDAREYRSRKAEIDSRPSLKEGQLGK